MWIPSDFTDSVLRHYPERKSVGYIDAVRLCDGRFVHRHERETFNAQACRDFNHWNVPALGEATRSWSYRTMKDITTPGFIATGGNLGQ